MYILNVDRVVIKRASSNLELDELLSRIRNLSKGRNAVQVFDPDAVINTIHIKGAYINAAVSFQWHTNKARNIAVEMLLFMAMTDQVDMAIKVAGAKSNTDFIVFSNSIVLYKKIKPLLKHVHGFKPDSSHVKASLNRYNIKYAFGKELTASILEKMAISRLDSY